jgi:hypothetical protein
MNTIKEILGTIGVHGECHLRFSVVTYTGVSVSLKYGYYRQRNISSIRGVTPWPGTTPGRSSLLSDIWSLAESETLLLPHSISATLVFDYGESDDSLTAVWLALTAVSSDIFVTICSSIINVSESGMNSRHHSSETCTWVGDGDNRFLRRGRAIWKLPQLQCTDFFRS